MALKIDADPGFRVDGERVPIMAMLITGASGFVGRHLVAALLDDGHRVVGVGRRPQEQRHSHYVYIQNDLLNLDLADLQNEFGFDTIVHLASVQPAQASLFEEFAKSNCITTERVCQLADKVKRIIFVSSMNVYAPPTVLPVDEGAPLNQIASDYYTQTKILAEKIIDRNFKENHRFITLRCASIFGRGHDNGIVYSLVSDLKKNEMVELFSEGRSIRELIYVKDLVRIIQKSMSLNQAGNYKINVGHGEKHSLREIAEFLKSTLKSSSQIVLSSKQSPRDYNFYYNVSQLKTIGGYEPQPLFSALADYAND